MKLHQEDLEYCQRDLQSDTKSKLSQQAGGNRIYIEDLVVSEIPLSFSFSLRGTAYLTDQSSTQSSFGGDIVDLLMSSIGITLTEVTDVDLGYNLISNLGLLILIVKTRNICFSS